VAIVTQELPPIVVVAIVVVVVVVVSVGGVTKTYGGKG
jgi:hypothetical protein